MTLRLTLNYCNFNSGTVNGSMMEVEEETSVTESGANLQLQSTVGIDPTSNQDMEEEEEPMTAIAGSPMHLDTASPSTTSDLTTASPPTRKTGGRRRLRYVPSKAQ